MFLPTQGMASTQAVFPSASCFPFFGHPLPLKILQKGVRPVGPNGVFLAGGTQIVFRAWCEGGGQVWGVIRQLHTDFRLSFQPSAAWTAAHLSKSS